MGIIRDSASPICCFVVRGDCMRSEAGGEERRLSTSSLMEKSKGCTSDGPVGSRLERLERKDQENSFFTAVLSFEGVLLMLEPLSPSWFFPSFFRIENFLRKSAASTAGTLVT